jgi:hypothetical protein
MKRVLGIVLFAGLSVLIIFKGMHERVDGTNATSAHMANPPAEAAAEPASGASATR